MSSAAYDSVVYDASAHPHTHPTRAATMAYLMGLSPPDVRHARVLELGCATGTNLLAMAEGYPEAEFIGIDYSAKQIETGRARIEASGLLNLKLEHRSIADITAADGNFDYIIAHGVYSWIPPTMQHALLAVLRSNLSRDGIAYISYNTLPGWSLSGIVRDVMLFHTRNDAESQKVPHAKAILEFLSKHSPADTAYGQLLRETSTRLAKVKDYYLAHEYLEEENEPIYFHQFVDRIRTHELEYLAEVELSAMLPNFLPPEVLQIIGRLAKNFVEYEQYLDFLRARTFRQSLVVHREAPLKRQITVDRLAGLSAYATFSADVATADIGNDARPVRFTTVSGQSIESSDPLFKTVLRFLADAAPRTLTVEEVIAGVARIAPDVNDAMWRELILMRLMEGFSGGVVRLIKDPPARAEYNAIDERPLASAAARTEALFGSIVTVKGHHGHAWDFVHLKVLAAMDGSRHRDDLLRILRDSHARGEFKFTDGTEHMPATVIQTKIKDLLEVILNDVRNAGLIRYQENTAKPLIEHEIRLGE